MGTKMAPSYANRFVFQQEALAAAPHSLLIWWRYIDEILLLWTHGEDKLNDFSIPDLHSVSSLPVPFPTTKSLSSM